MSDGSVTIEVELTKEQLEKGLKSIQTDLKKLEKPSTSIAKKISSGFENVGKVATKAGTALTVGLTTPLVALGTAGVKTANEFEAQMSRVKAISGATSDEFKKLTDMAVDLGASTSFSASEVASGMENLASAGFTVTEIVNSMSGMLDLAASSGANLATASEITASAIRGFGLEASKAEHVADVFAEASARTNAQVEDMGFAMKYIAPVAHAMGISLEETAAAIGIMSDAGIKGEQAGTTLRGALTRLTKPTDKMIDVMNSLGISFYDNEGKMKSLTEIIAMLQNSISGLSDEEQQYALTTLFGTESLSGMLALIDGGASKLSNLTKSFENCDGSAKKMADTMLDNTNGAIEEMQGAVETAFIKIQQVLSPSIKSIANSITELLNKFSNLDKGTQETILTIAGIVVAAGPVLGIVGNISKGISGIIGIIPNLAKGIGTASKAFKSFNAVLKANPILLVVSVIGSLIAILVNLYQTNEDFRNAITETWNSICSFFSSIPSFFQEMWENIKNFFINGWNSIVSFFTETIPQWIQNIITWFQELPYNLGVIAGEMFGHIVNFGVNAWNWVTTELPKIIQDIIKWFAELPGNIWNWLVSVIDKIIEWGQNTWNTATKWVSDTITAVIDWFKKLPSNIWCWLNETINKVINWGKDLINKGTEAAKGLFENIVNTIQELPSKMWDIGKNIVEGIWNGITGMGSWLKDKIFGFAGGFVDGVKNAFGIHSPSKLLEDEVGEYLPLGIWKGFDNNLKKVYSKMQNAINFETQKLSASLSTTASVNRNLSANITLQPSNIYMDSTKVGRAVTPTVSKTLSLGGAY